MGIQAPDVCVDWRWRVRRVIRSARARLAARKNGNSAGPETRCNARLAKRLRPIEYSRHTGFLRYSFEHFSATTPNSISFAREVQRSHGSADEAGRIFGPDGVKSTPVLGGLPHEYSLAKKDA